MRKHVHSCCTVEGSHYYYHHYVLCCNFTMNSYSFIPCQLSLWNEQENFKSFTQAPLHALCLTTLYNDLSIPLSDMGQAFQALAVIKLDMLNYFRYPI